MSNSVNEVCTEVVYRHNRPVLRLRAANLRVTAGVDHGKTLSLELHRVRVGKAADNDLVLSDPLISRYHLELRVQDDGIVVRDLGTTNGTFYKGARIREAQLAPGAELRLGETMLRLECGQTAAKDVGTQATFGELVGSSPPMQQLYGLLETIAPSDFTVLIEGETGTGKELVADALHRRSPRRQHPFCVVDCGAIPANLVESELFGHARGAFTGAVTDREGVFERADRGTLFLDEIGELPLEMQTRLLRVLERQEVKRVGDDQHRKVDVRILAATNRPLEQLQKEGLFRSDLYYRLAVVRVVLPPLRERLADIPILAKHFLWQAGCADPDEVLRPDVIDVLQSREWPGNVRELKNAVHRAMLFVDSTSSPEGIPAAPADATPPAGQDARVPVETLLGQLPTSFFDQPYKLAKQRLTSEFERQYVIRLLRRYGRNISKIAQHAGIDRRMVRKLLEKLALTDPEQR